MTGKRPIDVTVIEDRGDAVVVQWKPPSSKGGPLRSLVPASVIADGCADQADLRAGVPMSVDWAAEFRCHLTGERLAQEFERLGIWTVDDLRERALKAQRAVADVAVADLYAMLRRLGGNDGDAE